MKPNPFVHSLLILLAALEAEADRSTEQFDAIVSAAEKLLKRPPQEAGVPGGGPGRRTKGAIVPDLKEITRLARNGRRHVIKASSYAELAQAELEGLGEDDPEDREGASSPGPQVRSMVLLKTVRNSAGEILKYVFLIERVRYEFSSAIGALLEELGSDHGESEDRFVAFKSRVALSEALGVNPQSLPARVNRLRDKLEKHYGFLREVVETGSDGSYRLRLVRKGPEPTV